MTDDNTYSLGDLIFAKIKGFPWWPGTVVQQISNSKFKIHFFGDNSHAVIHKKLIYNFNDYNSKYPQINNNKKLTNAISQAKLYKEQGSQSSTAPSLQPNTIKCEKKAKSKTQAKRKKNNIFELNIDEKKQELRNEGKDMVDPQFELDGLAHLDFEEDDEKDSFSVLQKKTARGGGDFESGSSSEVDKEDLLKKFVDYLFCLTVQYLRKKRESIGDEEKKCLIKLFNYIINIEIDNISSWIKSSQIDVLLLHLINNIKDDEILTYANEGYESIMRRYILQVEEEKDQDLDCNQEKAEIINKYIFNYK